MKQIDYIKLKLENADEVNTAFLKPHPTIKNRYKMDFPEAGFEGKSLLGNNIDIFYNKNILYLSCSLPYLVYGHNFTAFFPSEARKVFQYLSSLLSVDLFKGKLIDFEVGEIFKLTESFKSFCRQITGVDGLELQKKEPSCIIYGKAKHQFKLYDISKNLKRKINIEARENFNWDKACDTVKAEFKFAKNNYYTLQTFLNDGFYRASEQLSLFLEVNIHFIQNNYSGNKFDDILFRALIGLNEFAPKSVQEMVMDEIDCSDLSSAKKTMRRKAFLKKQSQVVCGKQKKFFDFIDKSFQPNS